MPVPHYGVLKGHVVAFRPERDKNTPHFQIHMSDGKTSFRIAVNVMSSDAAAELLFLVNDDFRNAVTDPLEALSPGFHEIDSKPGGLGLDYVRGSLVDRQRMRTLPHDLPGEDNDLNDVLTRIAERAKKDPKGIVVYAFGARFGPETAADKVFKFKPTNGVHDIHMNQGNPNPGKFAKDNGVRQDGALLVHFTKEDRWTAVFLAFQTQAFHTDDATGHPLTEVGTGTKVLPSEPDKLVRIVAALVNPQGADEGKETVTLVNTTPKKVSLKGWKIANRLNQTHELSGEVDANAPLLVRLPANFQLTNNGGTITLINDKGMKVDGVSYTRADARDGRTVVF